MSINICAITQIPTACKTLTLQGTLQELLYLKINDCCGHSFVVT